MASPSKEIELPRTNKTKRQKKIDYGEVVTLEKGGKYIFLLICTMYNV